MQDVWHDVVRPSRYQCYFVWDVNTFNLSKRLDPLFTHLRGLGLQQTVQRYHSRPHVVTATVMYCVTVCLQGLVAASMVAKSAWDGKQTGP